MSFARQRLGGEPGAHTWVVYYPYIVIMDHRLVDDDVSKCVPHHALLTQIWRRTVARKGVCGRKKLEDFELLLRSWWKKRNRNHVAELLA